MDIFTIIAILSVLIVVVAYVNHLFFRLQTTIAMMLGALVIACICIALEHLGYANPAHYAQLLLKYIPLNEFLLHGVLSFLLFAGALSIDLSMLKSHQWEVAVLATISTIASTVCVGLAIFYLLFMLDIPIPMLYCFLFAALISPTDPIAVIATFKKLRASEKITTAIAGESLFNDGVGIVIFLTVFSLTFNHTPITISNVLVLFFRQAIGGIIYGYVLGLIAVFLIRYAHEVKLILLITLMVVTSGFQLATTLHISGALAMVVAGLVVGNYIRKKLPSETQHMVDNFWELLDEIINAALFLILGFEVIIIHISGVAYWAALLAIPITLIIRFITVATPMKLFQIKKTYDRFTISILTWGGLRGGLAVGLALSIPADPYRPLILAMTLAVVAFAIIVQGTTIRWFAHSNDLPNTSLPKK